MTGALTKTLLPFHIFKEKIAAWRIHYFIVRYSCSCPRKLLTNLQGDEMLIIIYLFKNRNMFIRCDEK